MNGVGYLTDDLLKQVAVVYTKALIRGDYPVYAVAARFGWNRNMASKRVQAARRRGHLPPTRSGVPRGLDRV